MDFWGLQQNYFIPLAKKFIRQPQKHKSPEAESIHPLRGMHYY